jgi:uncharacterized protein YoxC
MDTLMNANIFFFVTTIATIIFVILGSIVFVYVIRILADVRRASKKLEGGIDAIEEHSAALYHKIAESFVFNMIFGKKAAKKRPAKDTS